MCISISIYISIYHAAAEAEAAKGVGLRQKEGDD